MEYKIIKKHDIVGWLDSLIQEHDVFAPVREQGLIKFGKIDSAGETVLEYTNSKMPPKQLLFPQSEVLFSYSSVKDPSKLTVPPVPEKLRVIFGIRPCDAGSFLLLDDVFDGDLKDPYYVNRRTGTVIVSLGCSKPRTSCFCNWLGGGSFSTEGSDLLLTDIGDKYVVQVLTEKGLKLLEGRGFENAGKDELDIAEEVREKAEASMQPGVHIDSLKEKMDGNFDNPVWKEISEKCLGCGICTYLCPTCHCFDIVDDVVGTGGERLRTWDSCQFPLFVLQTSGENPRPTVKERFRQRIMHKYSYFIDNHDRIACVGCGRCITECPVNLDIRQVLNSISQCEGVK